jgi:hypothetical protein
MTRYNYRDFNKPNATAKKGEFVDMVLRYDKEQANDSAARARKKGLRARVFDRNIKVDGMELYCFVVVSRAAT